LPLLKFQPSYVGMLKHFSLGHVPLSWSLGWWDMRCRNQYNCY